jgi:hypothetical protein
VERTPRMAIEKIPSYSIIQVRKVLTYLEEWISTTEESLGNAKDAAYPNEEHIDKLNERLSALDIARDALEEIE